MTADIISCPDCERKLRVPPELEGTLVKCPSCGKTFTAQLTETAPPGQVPVEEHPPWEQEDEPQEERRAGPDPDAEDDSGGFDVVDDRDQRRPRRRRRRRHHYQAPHRGSMIMTLGILSLFMFPLILGPIAWIMGGSDLAEMRAGRMDPEGESNTNTGRICGMIATILYGAGIVLALILCLPCGCLSMMAGGGR